MNRFVVIDLETTGNSPKKGDKIIQFAAVVYSNGKITEQYSTFLNPEQSISPFIEQLTGITDEMVRNAPYFDEVALIITEMLEDAYFVAHNVLFDLNFLQDELKTAGLEPFLGPVLDTVEMTRFLYPNLTSYRLGGLAEHFKFQHDRPHQADSDAEVTALLLHQLLTKLGTLPYVTIRKLVEISANFTSDLIELLEELLTHKENKQGNEGIHYDIIRGIALKKRLDDEPLNLQQNNYTYPTARETFLSKVTNGELFYESEYRQSQLDMMDLVQKAFHGHEHAIIEAGTGLGKSIAYLFPAVIHSLTKKTPVVISTHTIQLQHQLLERDLPIINKILGVPITAVILKGKSNYISLFRFEQLVREVDNNYDSNLTKAKLLIWLTETETGDIDEINLPSGGQFLWERLSTEYTGKEKGEDPWEFRCFFRYMRKRAEKASIIITNHALLCREVFEESFIPTFHEMIIDEAHHLEDIVGGFLGGQIDHLTANYSLSRLGSTHEGGLLSYFYHYLKEMNGQELQSIVRVEERKTFIREETDELFRMLRLYALENAKREHHETGRVIYKYSKDQEKGPKWNAILECVNRIKFSITEAVLEIDMIVQYLDQIGQEDSKMSLNISELLQIRERMSTWKLSFIRLFLSNENENVTWIEIDEKSSSNSTYLYEQPMNVSDRLADQLFAKKKSVVLTSATLTVNNSFSYIIKRFGLTDFQPITAELPSPFNYSLQAQVLVPIDLPNIKAVTIDEYIAAIASHITAIATVTEGRMLVLFTSFDMLKKTFYLVKEQFELKGISLIGQGINGGSRSKITKNFMQNEQSVLFGTSSFWEGVDFPGSTLTCLVIVRLPFTPPSQPLFQGKAHQLEAEGLNSFNELSLPQAVIRFKQGFGRLIRSKTDKGIVFVFDKRIVTTWYGKVFIQSLPNLTVQKGNLPNLLTGVKDWLSGK
ncbi:ATP-dependent DNA helicase DinG [Bacillus sp. DJP31]|uniref:ATP-dependent DNA helicase DinG n=1 Tax=Bacillus sp. DJP31 TaxID=3409789 RepID=UPI003BB7553A